MALDFHVQCLLGFVSGVRLISAKWGGVQAHASLLRLATGLAPNPLVNSCNGLKKDPRTKSLVTNERLEALDLDGQVVKKRLGHWRRGYN